MRNNIIILSVLIFNFSYSQIYEVGFTIGKSNFIGDVGKDKYISFNKSFDLVEIFDVGHIQIHIILNQSLFI